METGDRVGIPPNFTDGLDFYYNRNFVQLKTGDVRHTPVSVYFPA
jgi:hypothetical protein